MGRAGTFSAGRVGGDAATSAPRRDEAPPVVRRQGGGICVRSWGTRQPWHLPVQQPEAEGGRRKRPAARHGAPSRRRRTREAAPAVACESAPCQRPQGDADCRTRWQWARVTATVRATPAFSCRQPDETAADAAGRRPLRRPPVDCGGVAVLFADTDMVADGHDGALACDRPGKGDAGLWGFWSYISDVGPADVAVPQTGARRLALVLQKWRPFRRQTPSPTGSGRAGCPSAHLSGAKAVAWQVGLVGGKTPAEVAPISLSALPSPTSWSLVHGLGGGGG